MKGNDASADALYKGQLYYGYFIRSQTHNHPSGNNNVSANDYKFYIKTDDITLLT